MVNTFRTYLIDEIGRLIRNAEVRAHSDTSLWPDVEDPATQHPNSARIWQILETYRRLYKETGREQPLLKNAR